MSAEQFGKRKKLLDPNVEQGGEYKIQESENQNKPEGAGSPFPHIVEFL